MGGSKLKLIVRVIGAGGGSSSACQAVAERAVTEDFKTLRHEFNPFESDSRCSRPRPASSTPLGQATAAFDALMAAHGTGSRNVEIKARLADAGVQRRLVRRIADAGPTVIRQRDLFFHTPRGRLKLRFLGDGSGQLIYYERPDRSRAATSHYRIYPAARPELLAELLESALGLRAVVSKVRELYLAGRTRIHLDRVEGLGEFLELEVVLNDGEPAAAGRAEAERLMARLEIEPDSLVDRAYVDLLGS